MKQTLSSSTFSGRMSRFAALVLASSMLVSCGDDADKKAEAKAPASAEAAPAVETPAPAATPTPEPEAALDPATAKDALFDVMLFKAVETMGQYAKQPILTETVRETLAAMQAYYDTLPEDAANSVVRTKLALSIADICRELTAYARAGEMYQKALSSFEMMPAADQDSTELKYKKSSIYNGIASCMLMNPATRADAAGYYKKQLDLDKKLYDALAPEGAVPTITPEVSTAVCNLVSSYRCMGDYQVVNDELEDARDTYKKAVELGTVLTSRTVTMMLEFIKLYTALGDLENKCGNDLPAAQAWGSAANACRQLFEKSGDTATKMECKRYFDRLAPLLKEKAAILKAAEEEKDAADAPAAETPQN